MIVEIIKQLTALKDTSKVSSKQVIMWDQTVEAHRSQKQVFENIRDVRSRNIAIVDSERTVGTKINCTVR